MAHILRDIPLRDFTQWNIAHLLRDMTQTEPDRALLCRAWPGSYAFANKGESNPSNRLSPSIRALFSMSTSSFSISVMS